MAARQKLAAVLVFLVILSIGAAVFDYDPVWSKVSSFRNWTLGLDLAGGSLLTYNIDLSKVPAADQASVVAGLRDVIEKRVNLFGVSEPQVYTEQSAGVTRLVVELAGVNDVTDAIKQIGETPFLDFRTVVVPTSTSPSGVSVSSTGPVALSFSSSSAPNYQFIPTDLNGRYVTGAQVTLNQYTQAPEVAIEFNSEGAKLFGDITAANVGKPLAIFLDNQLIEMPTVQQAITGGNAVISGSFTLAQAQTLAQRFNAGALPAPITLVNQQTVSADFGANALNRAVFAGLLGTLAVMLFMIVYYRKFGIFAAVALAMYVALTLAVFKIVPVTMSLSGIAGFILSIGMAVDANVLVFERTKEELKRGLGHYAAVEEGFKRAWTSIRDSNISTMITAAVLYYGTSSFVQGFALTLFIGVVVSMFSAITITRTMMRVFYGRAEDKKAAAGS
ncbi:protein translocase subunit SecD [Patescibacteria group bacterium]|nr:protein translocase subunit SecD [Patescibacteria group bacterium]